MFKELLSPTNTQLVILKIGALAILGFLTAVFIRRRRVVLAVIGILVVAVLHLSIFGFWLMDDAYITHRYAKNLASGQGLTFNPEEAVPIEGFSSPIYLFTLALLIKLGASSLYLTQMLSLLFFAVSMMLLLLSVRAYYEKSTEIALYSILFLSLASPYIVYAISGMENTLVSSLILLAIILYSKGKRALTALTFGFLAVARPEGFVIGIAALTYDLIVTQRASKRRFKECAFTILKWVPFIATFGAYFLFRTLYFEGIFPNTYYAKTGGYINRISSGIVYFIRFFVFFGLPLFSALFIIGRKFIKMYHLPLTLLVAYTGFIILAGGDLPAYRFFTYIIPLILLLGVGGLIHLKRILRRGFTAVLFIMIFTLVSATYFLALVDMGGGISSLKARGIVIGADRVQGALYNLANDINKDAEGDEKIALIDAGIVPYLTGLTTVDLWGLMDAQIAEWKYAYSSGVITRDEFDQRVVTYFYQAHADYLAMDVVGQSEEEIEAILSQGQYHKLESHHEFHRINEDERFAKLYEAVGVYTINDEYHLVLFKRLSS